jgi:hypothetical protein
VSRVYVYALVEEHRRTMKVDGRFIEFLPVGGGIHAAVERLDSPPPLSEFALRAQHRVAVSLARRCDSILPARFGAWVEVSELERVIRARARTLRRAFELVRHKEQMTLRVFGASGPVREPGQQPSSGTAYLRGRRESTRVKVPRAAASIRRALRSLVDRERMDAGRGNVRVTLHHLVDRGTSREYKAIVKRVRSKLADKDEIVVSGPWPPFAFTPSIWS